MGHSSHGDPDWLNRFTNVGKILTVGGSLASIKQTSVGRYSTLGQDGDRLFMDFICDGTETLLEISTQKESTKGIWDLYVNGVLDSSGYDDYNATPLAVHREITLTQPILRGKNTLELRLNDKNPASIGYWLQVYGASLQ